MEMFSSEEANLIGENGEENNGNSGNGNNGNYGNNGSRISALRQVAFNEAYDCLGMQSEVLLKKGVLAALALQRVRSVCVSVCV